MHNIEGKLNIDIYPQRSNGARIELNSSRPLQVTKLFIGKTPEQTLDMLPLLFSICGVAQSHAALSAIEQNLGCSRNKKLDTARNILVLVENTKEHLCRTFLDWPKLFDVDNNVKNMAYLSQMINKFKATLFVSSDAFSLSSQLSPTFKDTNYLIDKLEQYLQDNVFCIPLENWLQVNSSQALSNWAQHCDSIAANSIQYLYQHNWLAAGLSDHQPLPVLDDQFLTEAFDAVNAEQFIAQPQWQGQCCETTCLTRQYQQALIKALSDEFNNGLMTRWAARLVELAKLPQQLRSHLSQLNQAHEYDVNIENTSTSFGLSQVEAARGRLIHRVNIEHGLVNHYQILAPTEWNFHPQGLVAKTLDSLIKNNKAAELEKLSHIMINAIDPCVGYQLRIH